MSRPTEERRFPFVHARRIRWGESDPARIAYTARFLDFAMDAIEAFLQDRLGLGFYEINLDHGAGTPFVRVELDFRSPLTPRDTLGTEVRLLRLGSRSLTFGVRGLVGERLSFEGRLVAAHVRLEGASGMRTAELPPEWRARLAADVAFASETEPAA